MVKKIILLMLLLLSLSACVKENSDDTKAVSTPSHAPEASQTKSPDQVGEPSKNALKLVNNIINELPKPKENQFSDLYDDIVSNAHFKELVSLGNPAKAEMILEFKNNNSDAFKEYIMAVACAKISGEPAVDKGLGFSKGRDWFLKYGVWEELNENPYVDADFFKYTSGQLDKKYELPYETKQTDIGEAIQAYLELRLQGRSGSGYEKFVLAYETLRNEVIDGKDVYYLMVKDARFSFIDDVFVNEFGSSAMPFRIELENTQNGYMVTKALEPGDGGEYGASIKNMFPDDLAQQFLKNEIKSENLTKQIEQKANQYLDAIKRQSEVVVDYKRKQTPEDIQYKLYQMDQLHYNFPTWNGSKEALVKVDTRLVRCKLEALCTKEAQDTYNVVYKKTWDVKIDGKDVVSTWKYQVKGDQYQLIEKSDQDSLVVQ
jgi:hypothetical protein